MTKNQFAADLLQSANEALAISEGREQPARRYDLIDVAAIRHRQGYSQKEFAALYRLPLSCIQDWENGTRLPDGPARLLLQVIDRVPKIVAEIAEEAGPADERGEPSAAAE